LSQSKGEGKSRLLGPSPVVYYSGEPLPPKQPQRSNDTRCSARVVGKLVAATTELTTDY
jgi:hypothetical protein